MKSGFNLALGGRRSNIPRLSLAMSARHGDRWLIGADIGALIFVALGPWPWLSEGKANAGTTTA